MADVQKVSRAKIRCPKIILGPHPAGFDRMVGCIFKRLRFGRWPPYFFPLAALYEAMQKYARTKIAEQNGIDWRAQVRRILQTYARFEQVEYGVWRLNKSPAPGTHRVFNNKTS